MKMHAMTKILPLICLISGGLLYSAAASAMGNDDTTTPHARRVRFTTTKPKNVCPKKAA